MPFGTFYFSTVIGRTSPFSNTFSKAWIGRTVDYAFHSWRGVAGLMVGMLLVFAAAWLCTNRAATLEPSQALRYE